MSKHHQKTILALILASCSGSAAVALEHSLHLISNQHNDNDTDNNRNGSVYENVQQVHQSTASVEAVPKAKKRNALTDAMCIPLPVSSLTSFKLKSSHACGNKPWKTERG